MALCSTVPAVLHELREMLPPLLRRRARGHRRARRQTGVPVLIDNPKEVGADRIVNALAAHHLYGGPAIVVDFGTATNFDAVSRARASSSAARSRPASRSPWTRWRPRAPSCARSS